MATAPNLISLEEYMQTAYSPDCEYIDGLVLERNVGKTRHAYTQTELVFQLKTRISGRQLFAVVEQRVRVSATRVRVPDACVISDWRKKWSASRHFCASKSCRRKIAGAGSTVP
jgi:Uma2 family endonuclease